MFYVVFRENNRFHISSLDEWNNYISKYRRKTSVLESARRCKIDDSLVRNIQHSTSKLVQRWLREYWSDGECMFGWA